jgi:hypothetical protein
LAVKGSGESISLATSFIPTLIPFEDLVAINIEALIPYSHAFENISYLLIPYKDKLFLNKRQIYL